MSTPSNRQLATIIQQLIVEGQRPLIREANYIRSEPDLPPVKAEERKGGEREREAKVGRV